MAELQIIYWRDIPAQVMAGRGRDRVRRELSGRFAAAIDQAAMRAGLHGTDDYLSAWRRVSVAMDGEDAAAVDALCEHLENDFTDARLAALVALNGHAAPEERIGGEPGE